MFAAPPPSPESYWFLLTCQVLETTRTVTNRTSIPATITYTAALLLLKDHHAFPALQPLVTSNVSTPAPDPASPLAQEVHKAIRQHLGSPLSSPPAGEDGSQQVEDSRVLRMEKSVDWRAVTIAVPMPLFGTSTVVTMGAYIDIEDGILVVFQSGMGVRGVNIWKIKDEKSTEGLAETEEDTQKAGVEGLFLEEEATITANMLLMGFVLSSKKTSHTELGHRFVEALSNK